MLFQWLVAFAFVLTASIRTRKGSPVVLSELDTGILGGVDIPAWVLKLKSMPRMVHHLGMLLPLRSGGNIDFNDGQTLDATLHSSATDVVGALSTLSSKTHAIKGLADLTSQHATSAVAEVIRATAAPPADVQEINIASVVRTSLAKMHDAVNRLETEAVSMRQLVGQIADVLSPFQQSLVYQISRYTSCLFEDTRAGEASLESSNRLCDDRDAPGTKVYTSGICAGATKDGRLSVNEADMQERCAKDKDCAAYALYPKAGSHDFIPLVNAGELAKRSEFQFLARVVPYRFGCTDLLLNVRTGDKHNFQDVLVDFEAKGDRLQQALSATNGASADWSEVRTYVFTLCNAIDRLPGWAKDFDWSVQQIFKDQEKGFPLPFTPAIKQALQSHLRRLTEVALQVRLMSRAFAEVANERLLQLLNSLLTMPVDRVDTELMADVAQIGHDATETLEAVASQSRIEVAEFVADVAKNDVAKNDVADVAEVSSDLLDVDDLI